MKIKVSLAFSNTLFSDGIGRLLAGDPDLEVSAVIDPGHVCSRTDLEKCQDSVILTDFISLYNSLSEAAAGKNAVSHVGKIYNILAHKTAHTIYESVDGIKEVYVWLASQIGEPVNQPVIASAQVLLEHRAPFPLIRRKIGEIINKELSQMDVFCSDLLHGKYPVC